MVKSLPYNQVSHICQMTLCSKQEPCWASFLLPVGCRLLRSRCLGGCVCLYFLWCMGYWIWLAMNYGSFCQVLCCVKELLQQFGQRPKRMANKYSTCSCVPARCIPWQLGTSWSTSMFLDHWFSQVFITCFSNCINGLNFQIIKSGRSTLKGVAFASDKRRFFARFDHLRQRSPRICWEVPGVCRPETPGAKTAACVSCCVSIHVVGRQDRVCFLRKTCYFLTG